jgi:sulfur-oxidizing protein SoxA
VREEAVQRRAKQETKPVARSSVPRIALLGALAGVLGGAFWIAAGPVVGQAKREAPLALDGPASTVPWTRYRDWPKANWDKFNTLAKSDASPPAPKPEAVKKITEEIKGDAAQGQKLVFDRRRGGGCLACHAMGPASAGQQVGNVAPDLSEIGKAGRTDEWFYNYIYDARVYNPETVMPPWGAHGLYNDEEIRHMVAFLKTLKTPVVFKTAVDDPGKRPVPKEDRDNLDAMVNPGMWAVDKAKELWTAKGPSGGACVACHANPGAQFKTWAASMPRWEPRLNKVVGVEEFVFRHAKATTGHSWPMQSEQNLAMSIYLRNVANGAEIKVDTTSAGAKEAAARGEKLMATKIGQLNFACYDCHAPAKGALKWIRGQWLGESKGQIPHFPTWRTSRLEIWDIRKRFQWCGVAIRANELPPDAKEYGELELYLTSLNNGLKLNVPGIRH